MFTPQKKTVDDLYAELIKQREEMREQGRLAFAERRAALGPSKAARALQFSSAPIQREVYVTQQDPDEASLVAGMRRLNIKG